MVYRKTGFCNVYLCFVSAFSFCIMGINGCVIIRAEKERIAISPKKELGRKGS
jgi:hypothetical protein